MKWEGTLLTAAPALWALIVIWLAWDTLSGVASYVPELLLAIPLLCLVPLWIQFLLWAAPGNTAPLHPFGIVLPVGLVLVLVLLPAGERIARELPAFCELGTHYDVKPARPGKAHPTGYFSVSVCGRGNPRSYEFTLATCHYASYPFTSRVSDLYVELPEWKGFYINEYTKYFPVTRDKLLEYVQGSDDFPPGEVEALAGRLWEVFQNCREKQNLPPFVYGRNNDLTPQVVYYVPPRNSYLAAFVLGVPLLLALSWLLTRRYCRRVNALKGSQSPGEG